MAGNSKISNLDPAAGLTGTEELPVAQVGDTVKTTIQDIVNLTPPSSNLSDSDLTSIDNERSFFTNGNLSTNIFNVKTLSGTSMLNFRGDNVLNFGSGTTVLADTNGTTLKINSTGSSKGWNFFNSSETVKVLAIDNFGVKVEGGIGFNVSGVQNSIISATAGNMKFSGQAAQIFQFTGNSPTPRLTLNCGGAAEMLFGEGFNIATGTTTGTKISKTASQLNSFHGKTPIAQGTTGHAAATFTANTSGIADDTATFGGYTIGQAIQYLIDKGLLA